ncbi:MAG: 1-acyl-sn-glycerol-3-phosphate acyltransferase [Bacteroidales bacterium]|nr:1-acyl-sn-glycerol-3-phosphate acyltransferase [Bacteroidales bacterium]
MRKINAFLLKLMRYHIDTVNVPPEAQKCVLLFAPHTSYSDFIIGRMSLSAMGVKTIFLIKKEAFFFPLGTILRALGGMPVDRKNVRKFPVYAAEFIKKHDRIAFLLSPEGTRKLNSNWKKGFYFIAQEANVPIALGYLDYHTRRGGIGKIFYPTGDYDKDIVTIQEFYYGMCGRNKGHFNLENQPYAHPEWLKKSKK